MLCYFQLYSKVIQIYMHVLSHFCRVPLFATLWTAAHQAPLSVRFSRQEYWSGLPCPPPGEYSHLGIEPTSLISPVPLAPPGKCSNIYLYLYIHTHTCICVCVCFFLYIFFFRFFSLTGYYKILSVALCVLQW